MAEDPDPIEDEENPEWTEEDFARAKPFKEVFPDQYAAWKRATSAPKVHVGLHLSADVVDAIRMGGADYDARVEKVLRDALAKGEL